MSKRSKMCNAFYRLMIKRPVATHLLSRMSRVHQVGGMDTLLIVSDFIT
jgi:hypothetical protein